MNRYWLGIGAGALAVFGVGMGGIALGRMGLQQVEAALAAPVVESLQEPIGALRFNLDGSRIGRISAVKVQSSGAWTDESVRMWVQLDEPAGRALEACGIAGDRISGPGHDTRFRCVGDADVESEGLVQIGTVAFEPAGIVRPLYVSESGRRELERSDLHQLDATFTSADGESISGRATFDIESRAGRRERGVVSVQAGDGRALIDVRDASGRRLFQLDASERGVSMRASDGRGRELLELLAKGRK